MDDKNLKIILTGGGTLGSVAPLVSIWQSLKIEYPGLQVIFIGTEFGVEKKFLESYPEIRFKPINTGKLRRYFSWLNLFSPLLVLLGFFQSMLILKKERPDLIISAGGFAGVPLIFAAKIFRIKILIHQLDFKPTLSNLLTQNLASAITVTFPKSLEDFPKNKVKLAGLLVREEAGQYASLNQVANKILVLGGGTGAVGLNKLFAETLAFLPKEWQIDHVTGLGKEFKTNYKNYSQHPFLTDNYFSKLSQAKLVISRAGLSSLMELIYFAKPAILIPLPNSHQEENAQYFEAKNACLVCSQNSLTPQLLADRIKLLYNDDIARRELVVNIKKIAPQNGLPIIIKTIKGLLEDGN